MEMDSLSYSDTGHLDSSGDQQITFEIPSSLDFERISNFHNFTALLNSGSYHPGYVNGGNLHSNSGGGSGGSFSFGLSGDNHMQNGAFGKWPNSTDYHMILNYLWIGIVTLLVIMSVIFILFSCYFYRKFREWKKCNKDIRSQMQNDLYPQEATRNGYYHQMESPPCYTIATGLPTYDEALLHSQFMFGMKSILQPWDYPTKTHLHIWSGQNVITSAVKEVETSNAIADTGNPSPTAIQIDDIEDRSTIVRGTNASNQDTGEMTEVVVTS